MIPNVKDRALTSSGVSAGVQFGISLNDSAHLMTILRDTLYSDKILAVLREYGANAWDAHRSVGKGDLPIEVTLPTPLEPTLIIRDFGPGISHEDAFVVFTQYGASTKRGDDNSVGMLGIGSKSGFAYSDSFTVTSWNGGMKRIYTAVLDASDKGLFNLMHHEPCGDETGVMIQIAVKTDDIPDFVTTAKKLYRHFDPRPKINTDLPEMNKDRTTLKHGYIYANDEAAESGTGWTAVMGCVPYRVNLTQLRNLGKITEKVSGVLYFDIGAVQINASREELKYSDDTKLALTIKLTDLVDEFVMKTVADIESLNISPWEKKLRSQIFKKFGLPVPDAVKGMSDTYIKIGPCPPAFSLNRKTYKTKAGRRWSQIGEETTGNLAINEQTRILIRDDKNRALGGYTLTDYDCLVRKHDARVSWDDLEKELNAFLETLGVTGVPVHRLSKMDWVRENGETKTINPKHKSKVFALTGTPVERARGKSGSWSLVPDDWEPKKSDVFVLLESFVASDSLTRFYSTDKKLLKAFGIPFPAVYGYKTTSKSPVVKANLVGTPYFEWRKNIRESLCTKWYREFLETKKWASTSWHFSLERSQHFSLERSQSVVKDLGPDHLLSKFLRKVIRARKTVELVSPKRLEVFSLLDDVVKDEVGESVVSQQRGLAVAPYPLLQHHGIDNLWGGQREMWVEYVKLIDKNNQQKQENNDAADPLHIDERVDDVRLRGQDPLSPQRGSQLLGSEVSPP